MTITVPLHLWRSVVYNRAYTVQGYTVYTCPRCDASAPKPETVKHHPDCEIGRREAAVR